MKIIIITSLAYTLINFRYDLIKHMKQLGHEVLCITSSKTIGWMEDEINYTKSKLAEIDVKLITINLDRTSFDLLKNIRSLIHLINILKNEKPDYVISYTVKSIALGSIAAGICGIKKNIAWLTGTGALFSSYSGLNRFQRILGKTVLKIGLKLSTKIICLNKENKNQIIKLSDNLKDKIIVCIDGIDTNKFGHTPKINGDKIIVLFVGRLLKEKGLLELFEAAHAIGKLNKNIEFIIVGDRDENTSSLNSNEIENAKKNLNLKFVGSTSQVINYYMECDMLCLPSYHEGLPRVVLEAMSVGRPIITTDAPGCIDTIEHGISGIIVPIRNSAKLTEAILELANNPELRIKYGNNARKRVVKLFSSKENAKVFCNICEIYPTKK